MSVVIATATSQMIALAGDQSRFFDTLALLDWRHSPEVLSNVREAKQLQEQSICSEPTCPPVNHASSRSITCLRPLNSDLDFFSTASTGIALETRAQGIPVDVYLDLIKRAAEGHVLNTPYQLGLFLDHLGIDDPFLNDDGWFSTINFNVADGNHRRLAIRDTLRFWNEIHEDFGGSRKFSSRLEFLVVFKARISTWLKRNARFAIVFQHSVPRYAPSTHDWVHGFSLVTGVSPPAEASVEDVPDIRCKQKPKSMEKRRDFFCGQEDGTGGARSPRSGNPRRNRNTRRPQDRHSAGDYSLGRSALRRSWANCQEARCQTA